jgi:pilus assembly protein Flp/PilA
VGTAKVGQGIAQKGCFVNDAFLRLLVRIQMLAMRDEGQDLVEYALMTGLLAVAAVATIRTTATSVTHIFSNIGTTLAGA